MWPFSKKEKDEAEIVKKEVMGEILLNQAPMFFMDDGEYTRLSESKAKAFIRKAHRLRSSGKEYRKETLDCDDFVIQARSDVVDEQILQAFDAPFAFGSVYFARKNGERHVMNMTILKDGRPMFYEPQDRTFTFSLPEGAVIERVQF